MEIDSFPNKLCKMNKTLKKSNMINFRRKFHVRTVMLPLPLRVRDTLWFYIYQTRARFRLGIFTLRRLQCMYTNRSVHRNFEISIFISIGTSKFWKRFSAVGCNFEWLQTSQHFASSRAAVWNIILKNWSYLEKRIVYSKNASKKWGRNRSIMKSAQAAKRGSGFWKHGCDMCMC